MSDSPKPIQTFNSEEFIRAIAEISKDKVELESFIAKLKNNNVDIITRGDVMPALDEAKQNLFIGTHHGPWPHPQ